MKEFRIAQATKKLLAVAVEPVADILAVDVGAYPHVRSQASPEILSNELKIRMLGLLVQASDAHAYLMGGGQVIFHGKDDTVAEIRKFL